jgi:hypothetical protein
MIQKSDIPNTSLVKQEFIIINYQDCLTAEVNPNKEINVTDVARVFFNSAPNWVVNLMQLRDKIANSIGLKTDQQRKKDIERLKTSTFEVGEKFGLFEILTRQENEVIMGTDDKHLNFRVSIYLEGKQNKQYQVFLTTVVQINNSLGKVYFFFVKPFHKLIIKTFIRRIQKSLNKM